MEAKRFSLHEDAMFGVLFLSKTESFHKSKKKNQEQSHWSVNKAVVNIELLFFLFQQRILISFEFSNLRELFGFARMQPNLNKFKGQSEGKRRASCVVLF